MLHKANKRITNVHKSRNKVKEWWRLKSYVIGFLEKVGFEMVFKRSECVGVSAV